MHAPVTDRCPRCYKTVTRQHNDVNFWCSCGRHWRAREWPSEETAEIDHSDAQIAVDIPDVEKKEKKAGRGRNRRVVMYTFDNRALYLRRNNLTEAEIMLDEQGKEYWIKDYFHREIS